jgi:hypothetical protein
MTTGRMFLPLFGQEQGQDVRRTAIAAVKAGYAVVPVEVGGKAPICTLNSREIREAGPGHRCGVHHAITDPAVADRVFKRLGEVNLGVVAGPSRLLVVDADTAAEVEAFQSDWADAEGEGYRDYTPTVRTPGLAGDGGEWRHKDGGHFYFDLPEGVVLPWDVKGMLKHHGYDVKWGMSQTLVPPSVRPEGRYVPTGDILPAPRWLLDLVLTHLAEVEERRLHRAALTANDDVASWASRVTWAEILEPHGWTDSGKADRCGCSIWTKPGGGSTSYKSATAHEADCTQYDNIEGHGPLHLWTTEPPEELASYVLAGTQTLTKLQVVAAYMYGNDVDAAMDGLGIGTIDLDGWLTSPDSLDDSRQGSVRDVKGEGTLDSLDSLDAPTVNRSSGQPDGVSPDSPDSLDAPTVDRSSGQPDEDVLVKAVDSAMTRNSIPAHLRDRVMQSVAKELLGRAAKDALAIIDRGGDSNLAGWLGGPDDIEAFLGGKVEEPPALLPRNDGRCLLYAGRTNVIVGRRGGGKTWLAIHAAAEALAAGMTVLYYDMEDTAQAWRSRMKAIGCDIDLHVREGRAVWKKPPDIPVDGIDEIVEYAGRFDLVVFDVVNRLVTRLGGTPDSGNREILWLYDNLFDPLAQSHGCCVLLLDHPNRKGQRQDADSLDDLAPGGGAMKMNNASGHVIAMVVRKPFTREDPNGEVRLHSLKDRNGHFEENACVGVLRGDATEAIVSGIALALTIAPPSDDDEIVSDQQRVERTILRELEEGPKPRSGLTPRITRGLREWFEPALIDLMEQGRIEQFTKKHPGNGKDIEMYRLPGSGEEG